MRRIAIPRSKRTISAAIFVVALLVRLLPMGLYVTPDEPIWVLRSLRMYDALRAGDLSAIPQTGHPGMTTMAFGALSIAINSVIAPEETATHANWLRNMAWLAPENSAAFPHLYYFLPLARFFVALTTSLCVALLYLILCKRLGKRTAGLAALFIALSPFLTGLSGLLHTDALQASFAMLAVSLVLPQGEEPRSHSWTPVTLAALCLALAGMSKTLGWLIAPGAALILLFSYRGSWWQRIGLTAVLTLATLAFAAMLYPPLWVQPAQAFDALVGAVGYHEDLGLRDVFFLGEMRANPGVWFYPAVLLFRLTSPVLLGLVWVIVKVIKHIVEVMYAHLLDLKTTPSPCPSPARGKVTYRTSGWLFVPTFVYLLGITVATKKFDRYVASVFPMLAIIAAAQWQSILRKRLHLKRVVLALLLLPIALTLVLPLYFADPLVGGPWLAQNVIPLGWGEGAGLAANRLNSMNNNSMLMTSNVPGAASFYRGAVYDWEFSLLPCVDVYFAGNLHTQATFSLHIAGIPIVYITPTDDIPAPPVPGFLSDTSLCDFVMSSGISTDSIATFDGSLDLLAYHVSTINEAPDALTLKLRWLPRSAPAARNAYLVLHGVDDTLVWDEGGGQLIGLNGWPAEKWIPGEVIDAEAYIPLDLTLPPGTYRLGLRLLGDDSNWLGVTTSSGEFAGVELDLGEVEILAPRYPVQELDLPAIVEVPFEGGTLMGYSDIPSQRYAGETVPFQIAIEREADDMAPLAWKIACDDGSLLKGDVFVDGDLSWWSVGRTYILRYAPSLPVDMPDTSCQVGLQTDSGLLTGLGAFEGQARVRSFEFASRPQQELAIQAGDFAQLIGMDAPDRLAQPSLDVALYWSVTGTTETDYTVFMQLLGLDGQVITQIDALPAQGTAPTSTWLVGQTIFDIHSLGVPENLPAGEYTLITGLYNAMNGTRVPLYDSTGRLDGDYALLGIYTITE